MIDIIVIDYGKDLIKTLASIYIQTICDKVNVYLIGKEKNEDIDGFKDKLKIKEYYGSINKMKKEVLNSSDGEFIYTMYSGDVFYDVFALDNVIKWSGGCDGVISRIVNKNVAYIDFVDRGNLYRRKYLIDNNILDLGYEKMFLMSGGKYMYANDCIYVYNSRDNTKSIINEAIKAIDEGYRRAYGLNFIANTLYDVVLYMAYYYSDKKVDVKELKKYYDRYKTHISEDCYGYYTRFYYNDLNKDCKAVETLLVK